jgi:RNA polymerase nonessential primary-like sigma factor
MNLAYKSKSTGADQYLNEIGKYRLLTAEEEILLGKRIQRMQELQEKSGPLTAAEKREVRLGQRAQEKFVRSNLRLVVNVARKYLRTTKSLELMDLVQEGNIGLIRGVQKFDPSRGYKFSTYAFWWIRQAMTRAISQKDRAMKLPTKAADIAMSWGRKVSDLSQELGRVPSNEELAQVFNCSVDEILMFKERGVQRMVSLDASFVEDNDCSLMDSIRDPLDPLGHDAVDKIFYTDCKHVLYPAMAALNERERDMLKRHWGFVDGVPQGYAEIGRVYDISRERVRQVLKQAERKLKYQLWQSGMSPHQLFEPV